MLHSLYSKTNCTFQMCPVFVGCRVYQERTTKPSPHRASSRAILSALNHPPTILPLASTTSVIKSFPECSKTSCCFRRNPSGLCKPPPPCFARLCTVLEHHLAVPWISFTDASFLLSLDWGSFSPEQGQLRMQAWGQAGFPTRSSDTPRAVIGQRGCTLSAHAHSSRLGVEAAGKILGTMTKME